MEHSARLAIGKEACCRWTDDSHCLVLPMSKCRRPSTRPDLDGAQRPFQLLRQVSMCQAGSPLHIQQPAVAAVQQLGALLGAERQRRDNAPHLLRLVCPLLQRRTSAIPFGDG